jgi:GNAT superfamily N-acetyltransferase
MIRPAKLEDIPAMVELGRLMHGESPLWSRLAYSPFKVGIVCERLIELDGGFAFVGERDGSIVGAMLGVAEEHWMSNDKVATELALFVESSSRGALLAARLVSRFVVWAEDEGARLTVAGVSTGVEPERTAQFYERFGFSRNGAIGLERVM